MKRRTWYRLRNRALFPLVAALELLLAGVDALIHPLRNLMEDARGETDEA